MEVNKGLAMKKATTDKVRLAVNLDKELKDEFLKIAKENNTDANKLVRGYIQRYIARHKQEKQGEKE